MSNKSGKSFAQKLKHELQVVALTTLYFLLWLGVLMVLKVLILAGYHVAFRSFSMVLVGALILAKVVLLLEHVPLGSWIRQRPAVWDVLLRTSLYALGVFVVLLLEKTFETRHDYGGFGASLLQVFQHRDMPHVWANAICVASALLAFNALSVVRRHLGKGGLRRLYLSPLPEELEAKQ